METRIVSFPAGHRDGSRIALCLGIIVGMSLLLAFGFIPSGASGYSNLPESSGPSSIFLPIISSAPNPIYPQDALQALNRINSYRRIAGLPLLSLHPSINDAARNHVAYTALNANDASAFVNGPHNEIPGKPGYTGVTPQDRLNAAGYPWFGGTELIHYVGDPLMSVDGWMATIYHRLFLLDIKVTEMGYSYQHDTTVIDVVDFGFGPTEPSPVSLPYPLVYPANGQTGIPPSWNGYETPNPLPPNAQHPVGYPFTLQGIGGQLSVISASLKDTNGAIISVYPSPSDCPAYNCYALIPVSPLKPNTVYKVTARGNVGNAVFDRQWTFTTGSN